MSALIIRNFIQPEERSILAAGALEYLSRGVLESSPAGPNRYRKKIFNTQYCAPLVSDIAHRIASHLNLEDCPIDPYLGWIISVIKPGGFIQPHRDAHQHYQETGDKHLRCNLLIQGTDISVQPKISNLSLDVGQGDLWAFFASDHVHGTNIIEGEVARIVYQFGFVVPAEYPLSASLGEWVPSSPTPT